MLNDCICNGGTSWKTEGGSQTPLDDEEAAHILAIAERDFILDFYADTLGPTKKLVAGCSWIPPEERASFADAEKENNRSFKKWLEKKIMQGDY